MNMPGESTDPSPTGTTYGFTAKYSVRAADLRTDCKICPGFDPSIEPAPAPHQVFTALWDTGASISAISAKVVAACGLVASGETQNRTVRGGPWRTPTYRVNVILPNTVQFKNVVVLLGEFGPVVDILLGMDIISAGDFSVIQEQDGGTLMSFRMNVPMP